MNSRLKIAKDLLNVAKMILAKELVIIPYDGEHLNVDHPLKEINADDDTAVDTSNIGNKTDKSFPYEIWAIDVRESLRGRQSFTEKIRSLIQKIQGNPLKKWVLWTSGKNLDIVKNFCKEQGFQPDAVNDNIDEVKTYYGASSRKVYAHHYIDARNVTMDNVNKIKDENRPVVYAIDFDGTIAETDRTFPQIEKPIDRIVNFIKEMQKDPMNQWVLYTCRVGEAEKIAEQWCHENGLFPNAVNSNVRSHGERKIDADYYIDDRNVDLSKL